MRPGPPIDLGWFPAFALALLASVACLLAPPACACSSLARVALLAVAGPARSTI